jgi:hypothetical protein
MRIDKYLILFIFSLFSIAFVEAQEVQARVSVLSQRVSTTVDRKVFQTLQNQLNTFINNRKWTNDKFGNQERIECSFIINIESMTEQNVFKASLTIQAARPVFNTSYKAPLINFQDPDLLFKYQEFQPIEFNDNRVQGSDPLAANLTATLAFWIYIILGMDYDSFSPKGGEAYFQKALSIVNNAPEARGISGWRVFDGLRNRYFLAENLTNTRFNIVHDVIYGYYRSGLDQMYESEDQARKNTLQALSQLFSFNKENPNTMFVQFFMQGKFQELSGMFKKAGPPEKSRAIELLTALDIVQAEAYKLALK